MQKSAAVACAITLEVNGARNLFVLLGADGTVNRQGNGQSDSDTKELYLGATNKPLFKSLMMNVSDDLFQRAGRYGDPAPRGLPCKLTITFEGGGESAIFEYEYGSESSGPPAEIRELIVNAIALTNPYYIRQGRKGLVSQAKDAIRRLWQ